MSRKTFEFTAFGIDYRTKAFSAYAGLEMMDKKNEIHPCELLADSEVKNEEGEWKSLGDRDNVNACVKDAVGILPPILVLRGIVDVVYGENFRFVEKWSGLKIPSRFTDQAPSAQSKNINPMLAQIIQDGAATMRELEEYYSMEDAFKMFDVIIAKGLSEALSSEAASIKSRRK